MNAPVLAADCEALELAESALWRVTLGLAHDVARWLGYHAARCGVAELARGRGFDDRSFDAGALAYVSDAPAPPPPPIDPDLRNDAELALIMLTLAAERAA